MSQGAMDRCVDIAGHCRGTTTSVEACGLVPPVVYETYMALTYKGRFLKNKIKISFFSFNHLLASLPFYSSRLSSDSLWYL